ncbi:class I SAM-dependent methyltransferase [Kribbella sp. NBC_00889]|uniref:class I SAM-dependent methyltransferase n=1 Tax=Kribbella sp. NBC_00889 TaxID=2975974 RepID=UPI003870A78A|nr:methyltransferase domain-containing protein [Kribbella sp. NBC_00889]
MSGTDLAYGTGLTENSLYRYDDWLLRAAAIRDGDRVLDIGCGTGGTTRAAAWLAGSGDAVGVDLSEQALAEATRRAEETGAVTATFVPADAQVHAFETETFDVLLSRTGCTDFADPIAAFTNLARALRPGGRVALLVWQAPSRNPWYAELTTGTTPRLDVPGPFAFADPARVAHILTTAGFRMPECEPLQELIQVGPGVDYPSAAWLVTTRKPA